MGNDLNAEFIYSELMKTYYMPESYERWREYRSRVTDYIIKYTEPGKTLAIIGAGDSNDIDLARLYGHLGNLALYDIDLESMNRALNKYNLIDKPCILVERCDLFGATKADYLDLINICLKDLKRLKKIGLLWSPYNSSEKYLEKLSEIFDRVNSSETYITDKKYDYTIMIGVYSQILAFTERIWAFFLRVVNKVDNVVSNKVHAENEILMPRINDAVLDMTKERAFIGGELFEHGREIIVQGAQQGLIDIEQRIKNGELKCDTSYQDLWPHREGVVYEMLIHRVEL